jgi:enterochelin esterase-like enzyme
MTDETRGQAQTRLEIGADPIERVLTGTEPHEYMVDFTAGEFYAVSAFQDTVDLLMEVYAPDGTLLASIDTLFGTDGMQVAEEWNETAATTGRYRFVLQKYDANEPDGKYTMMVRGWEWYIAKWAKENIKSPRMARLCQDYATNPNAVDDFLAEREGKGPLIEPKEKDEKSVLVTFFVKAPPSTSRVDLWGGPVVERYTAMAEFGDTGLWFVTLPAPKNSRFRYGFDVFYPLKIGGTWVTKSQWIYDPSSPLGESNPLGEILILEDMPDQPFNEPLSPDTPRGTVTPLEIESMILGEKRTYSVYTPPHFDASKTGSYGVLFVFDGEDRGTDSPWMDLPKIMNNAIEAGKVPPMILVLVNNMGSRDRDLVCYEPFADFMATELLPDIRQRYPATTQDPSRVIVAGSSFGGVASTFCAMMHPEAFGNVLSQSGAYWVPGNDWSWDDMTGVPREAFFPAQFAGREKLPIRFYMEVGTYEGTGAYTRTNRHLRDVLQWKGYDVTYSEFHGNHDANVWRGTITDGIACLTRDWK